MWVCSKIHFFRSVGPDADLIKFAFLTINPSGEWNPRYGWRRNLAAAASGGGEVAAISAAVVEKSSNIGNTQHRKSFQEERKERNERGRLAGQPGESEVNQLTSVDG